MKVVYHPEFPRDILRFCARYQEISPKLAHRFASEANFAVDQVKSSPRSAGHFLHVNSEVVREFRRRNLSSFPFFVLYAVHDDTLIFGAMIPSASDPLTWLSRFRTREDAES